jgi:hypothetical protein
MCFFSLLHFCEKFEFSNKFDFKNMLDYTNEFESFDMVDYSNEFDKFDFNNKFGFNNRFELILQGWLKRVQLCQAQKLEKFADNRTLALNQLFTNITVCNLRKYCHTRR